MCPYGIATITAVFAIIIKKTLDRGGKKRHTNRTTNPNKRN